VTKYVSLSTDQKVAYAIWAPLVVRFWRHLGYTPIVFVHHGDWSGRFEDFVLATLVKTPGVRLEYVPRTEPLSVGNTMRVARLAAGSLAGIQPDDFIITADIDMAPISRAFFERDPAQIWLLRADMYGGIPGAAGLLHDKQPALICGQFRLPLCYIGMPAIVWQKIMPYADGDPIRSIRNINHGLGWDAHDHDEACTSARLLLSSWGAGPLVWQEDGTWKQGALNIIPKTDWPKGTPIGMLLGGQARTYKELDPSIVDWHMKEVGRWVGSALSVFWPEEKDFIDSYWPEACRLAGV